MSSNLINKESKLIAEEEQRKQNIINTATEYNFLSAIPTDEVALTGRKRIPVAEITTLGIAFQPLVDAIQALATSGKATSGLYWVNAKGGTLVSFKDGSGVMGSISNGSNAVGGGQAVLNKVGFTPEMASQCCMAVTMLDIEHRLNKIQQAQEELLTFIEEKDKYMLKGSLYFLLDMLSNYKYNFNNPKYTETNHIKILDIKEDAEQSILLYSNRIKEIVDDKALLHIDSIVKDKLKKLQGYFKSYQIALYNYAFSSFLDVILLGNFDSKFLDAIISKIDKYSLEFRETYTIAYNKIEVYNDSAIDNIVIKGTCKAVSKIGNEIGKIKRLDKFGNKLDIAAKALNELTEERKEDRMEQVISNRTNYALPFKDAIEYIKKIYNSDFNVIVSQNSLYINETIA